MFGLFLQSPKKEAAPVVKQGRILVIDSDVTVGHLISTHFEPEGFDVELCESIAAANNRSLSEINLIVIDLNVDGDGGLRYIEQLKQQRDTSSIGIIATSVNMSPSVIVNTITSGADDYLIKPFSVRELLARVRAVLRRQI